MDAQNEISTGRLIDQSAMIRRIYWLTPLSVGQSIATGRLRLTPIRVGRKNYYRIEDVEEVVRAYETLHGGQAIMHKAELAAIQRRMESMTQGEALALAKSSRVAYLLAEAALGKRWADTYLGRVD